MNSIWLLFILLISIPFGFTACRMGPTECEPSGTLLAEGARSEAQIIFKTEDEKYWREGQWGEKIEHKKLVDAVFDAVYSGRTHAYDFFDGKPISADEVKKKESRIDTLFIENPDSGTMDMKIVEVKLDRNDIAKIFFRENWYLDEANFKFSKKVTAITLTTAKYSPDGEYIGLEPLFSVYCDTSLVPVK
ncbi:MAG: hypothetical protein HYY40_06940 [Bacteroidetes bacterium]|nr:hypothetical protein [Bacteroidota bacterium]